MASFLAPAESLTLGAIMQLLQSRRERLLIHVSVIVLITLAVALPKGARAATQHVLFSPTTVIFGDVPVGHSEAQVIVVSNSGSNSIKISAISVSGSEFRVSSPSLPLVLGAGKQVALKVVFAPTTRGWIGEKLTLKDNASNPSAQLSLSGAGVKSDPLIATPASLSFGQVPIGTKVTHSIVVKNNRPWKETLKAVRALGTGFSVSGPTMPLTLLPGKSVTLRVSFAPQFAGEDGGSIFLAGVFMDIPVTGTGAMTTNVQLTVAPTALNFGNVDVGATRKATFNLTASGGSVQVSSAASSNSQFTISGASFPLTIAAGQSEVLDVVFAPSKGGTSSGKLTLTSNASNSQSSEAVSGIGIVPQYSVNLSWNASTPPVSGYNVYRGTTAGHYSKINTSLDANTAYTDTTVVSGTTYYYAATTVNTSGQESSYSSAVKVVIP